MLKLTSSDQRPYVYSCEKPLNVNVYLVLYIFSQNSIWIFLMQLHRCESSHTKWFNSKSKYIGNIPCNPTRCYISSSVWSLIDPLLFIRFTASSLVSIIVCKWEIWNKLCSKFNGILRSVDVLVRYKNIYEEWSVAQ